MENPINCSFKDNDEERVMHSKSNSVEIMINDKEGDVRQEFL